MQCECEDKSQSRDQSISTETVAPQGVCGSLMMYRGRDG